MKRMAGVVALALLGTVARTGAAELDGTIGISGAWALYPMVVRWGEEFQKLHPKVRFDISAGGAGKGMTDVLSGAVDLGMVSREIVPVERERGAIVFAVTKDAVVAIVSARNPALDRIRQRGIARETLARIWTDGSVRTWGEALDTPLKAPLRVYTRSDACGAAQTWAAFFGTYQEDLKGIGVYGDPGIGEAIRRDPLGIGYGNVNYAYDASTLRPVQGLAVVPLDLNGNGKVDPEEDFTGNRTSLTDAIARGVYPSPPARDLYLVTRGKPKGDLTVAFLRWALTDGQRFVGESGYIPLSDEQLNEGLRALDE